jgi:DNA-binding transcriptional MerR regulator
MQDVSTYSLTELARKAAVSPRTVRYYIQHDLLPPPKGAGPGSHYDDGHLGRLRLIKRLKDSHLPLAEIRKQIKPLSDDEVSAVVEKEPEELPGTAIEYIREMLNVREEVLRNEAGPKALLDHRQLDHHALFSLQRPSPSSPAQQEPTRAHWERIGLSPDIEIHVRRPLSYQQNKAVNRILEAAREILKEETR